MLEAAQDAGITNLRTLGAAFISLRLNQGWGPYYGQSLTDVEPLRPYVQDIDVLLALTAVYGGDTTLDSIAAHEKELDDAFASASDEVQIQTLTAFQTRENQRVADELPIPMSDQERGIDYVLGYDQDWVKNVHLVTSDTQREIFLCVEPQFSESNHTVEYSAYVQYADPQRGKTVGSLTAHHLDWKHDAELPTLKVSLYQFIKAPFELVVTAKDQQTYERRRVVISSRVLPQIPE